MNWWLLLGVAIGTAVSQGEKWLHRRAERKRRERNEAAWRGYTPSVVIMDEAASTAWLGGAKTLNQGDTLGPPGPPTMSES